MSTDFFLIQKMDLFALVLGGCFSQVKTCRFHSKPKFQQDYSISLAQFELIFNLLAKSR